ncbi:Hpt domain-containing protein [Piscinibacter sp.]|uniref:Hpt domain-containing protein n=1 Tax=Piscinibacter sp. TaxID=1903157 RepID=UPI001E016539|nr:Hpt domain-containing protein [Piscinibacter sp.]MBK7529619.1 Hpt domain-containing protein [Piscinibacter sp.]
MDPDRLYQVLLAWLPVRAPAVLPAMAASEGRRSGACERRRDDVQSALRRVGNNVATLERVLRCFAGYYQRGDSALARAIETSDPAALLQAAHALAGACGSIGAVAPESQARADRTACARARPRRAGEQAAVAPARNRRETVRSAGRQRRPAPSP